MTLEHKKTTKIINCKKANPQGRKRYLQYNGSYIEVQEEYIFLTIKQKEK